MRLHYGFIILALIVAFFGLINFPIGTAISMAVSVTHSVPTMNGAKPNCPAIGFHTSPVAPYETLQLSMIWAISSSP